MTNERHYDIVIIGAGPAGLAAGLYAARARRRTMLLERSDSLHVVHTKDGDYTAKAVILTGGADYNRLGVPGEEALIGKGVSYCATCDAAFFKDQVCAVVGGGDAAMD